MLHKYFVLLILRPKIVLRFVSAASTAHLCYCAVHLECFYRQHRIVGLKCALLLNFLGMGGHGPRLHHCYCPRLVATLIKPRHGTGGTGGTGGIVQSYS